MIRRKEKIRSIAFDLDDTLLDTSNCLIPPATKEALKVMISAGLNCELNEGLNVRQQIMHDNPRANVFLGLVQHFGVAKTQASAATDGPALFSGPSLENEIVRRGSEAFYSREVREELVLLDGAIEVLEALRGNYELHLVTSGTPSTQAQKVGKLGIGPYFRSIQYVNPQINRKNQAFARIQQLGKSSAANWLSVGNRVDTDLGEAKILGWQTCWMRYGEYKTLLPSVEIEKPDFEINTLRDLMRVCNL